MKHVWINKRTPKGVKPVREWIECKTCGTSPGNAAARNQPECEQK